MNCVSGDSNMRLVSLSFHNQYDFDQGRFEMFNYHSRVKNEWLVQYRSIRKLAFSKMRITIAISLVIALLSPILVKNYLVFSFYAHREQITREHCIEKNVESSCCKGSCFLTKKMKDLESKNESSRNFKELRELIFVFDMPVISHLLVDFFQTHQAFYFRKFVEQPHRVAFKPPTA